MPVSRCTSGRGSPVRVTWYDSMTVDGGIDAAPEGPVLLGATATPAFHVRDLRRRGGERYARLEITAVGHDYERSAAAVLRHRW